MANEWDKAHLKTVELEKLCFIAINGAKIDPYTVGADCGSSMQTAQIEIGISRELLALEEMEMEPSPTLSSFVFNDLQKRRNQAMDFYLEQSGALPYVQVRNIFGFYLPKRMPPKPKIWYWSNVVEVVDQENIILIKGFCHH